MLSRSSILVLAGYLLPPLKSDDNTALNDFPLVFEDQYLELTPLPYDASVVYRLGEVYASVGFRRDFGTNEGFGAIQTG